MRGGPSGWGRNLHFLSAWVCVLNGSLYTLSGIVTRHFPKHLLPAKADWAWSSVTRVVSSHLHVERLGVENSLAYNLLQKVTYLAVVFVLVPLMIWTGFAMSPTLVSILPALVTVVGGQQSARTIHFFAADLLVLFLLVHIVMVYLAGFRSRTAAMITGHSAARGERP
jgi:thiosulfate reductase cytochrome b subunit